MVAVARSRVGRASIGVVMGAVTVVDEDGALARRLARTEVARYVDVVGPLDPTAPIDPELAGRVRDLVARHEHEAAGAARAAGVGGPAWVSACIAGRRGGAGGRVRAKGALPRLLGSSLGAGRTGRQG
jgi:hypothetical protein